MPVRLGAALVAEFVGTFALCMVGVLAINHGPAVGGLVGIALAHGLILSTMVTAAMPTSGGHFNPAVTVGFLLTGKIKPVAATAYIVIQLLGGVLAAVMVYFMFGAGGEGSRAVFLGTPNPAPSVAGSVALLAEIFATFMLVFVIWGSAADPRARNTGGFAIGLTVAANILAFGAITGASMNPARSFGPTLIAAITDTTGKVGETLWPHHWIYWIGPLIGGVMAAVLYHLGLWPRDSKRGIDPGASDVPATQRP